MPSRSKRPVIIRRLAPTLSGGLVAALLVFMPLLGAWLDGREVRPYLSLFSEAEYVPAAPFSWAVFVFLSAVIILWMAPFLLHLTRSWRSIKPCKPIASGKMPWWGRVGLLLLALSWGMAWTRIPWFAPFQEHTFEPLWLSYIVVVNGWTHKRTGRCLLTEAPGYLLALFAASLAFWWYFEFLNGFARNWYYYHGSGQAVLNPWASLPFSTVLPGVISTCDLLRSFARVRAGMGDFIKIEFRCPAPWAWLLLLLASGLLAGIGFRPDLFFPALWLSPLLLIIAVQVIVGEPTILGPLKTGDWTHLWLMAVSALVCGFFWEMWNFFSHAHWEYAVPYVGRFYIFEMPLLGYAGYLPFGLECAAIADVVRKITDKTGHRL